MDQHIQRGRSPSAGHQSQHQNQHQQHHINHSLSPSPTPYQHNDPSIGLGLTLDQSAQHSYDSFNNSNFLSPQQSPSFLPPTHQQHQQQNNSFVQANLSDPAILDPNNTASFGQQPAQPAYLSPNLNDNDFSLFPNTSAAGDQYNAPLFDQSTLNPNDMNTMAQGHHSPTPPHLFQHDAQQPGSAHQSPAFNQHQFSSPPSHSRHASLGPGDALLPNQIADWSQPQFQGHRRTPSEYSDVSSVAPSPNLVSAESFETDLGGHSPAHRPSDGGSYQELLSMGNFSLSDPQVGGSPGHQGRSPSHSPAISPRIVPQQMPDLNQLNQNSFGLAAPHNPYGMPSSYPDVSAPGEAFPTLQPSGADLSSMAPPAINIDFAPTNAKQGAFDTPKSRMDQDSLTPPDRGMLITKVCLLEPPNISQAVLDLVLVQSQTLFTLAEA